VGDHVQPRADVPHLVTAVQGSQRAHQGILDGLLGVSANNARAMAT
jgi:hypothetical protein